VRIIFVILFITTFTTTSAFAVNKVLSLDGDGDYVEIAESKVLNAMASQVTMEAWIKPTAFTSYWMPIMCKGDERAVDWSNKSYVLLLNRSGSISLASAPSGKGQILLNSPDGLIVLNSWYHVAGVIDAKSGVMKIFINGVEVASKGFPRKDIYISRLPLRIGESHEVGRQTHYPFAGRIDDVRIWNIARTQDEIQRTMHTILSGKEY